MEFIEIKCRKCGEWVETKYMENNEHILSTISINQYKDEDICKSCKNKEEENGV